MNAFDLSAAATTFALILPAELPDKTFIATLVLGTRFPRWPVWLGVVAAFFVQCAVAVTAGGLLSLLPDALVAGVAGALFAIGAVIMLRGAVASQRDAAAEAESAKAEELAAIERAAGGRASADSERSGDEARLEAAAAEPSNLRVFGIAFTVLFLAEWGDLSQLLTAGLAARTGEPLSVFVGAWLALALVGALAVGVGGWLQQRIPLHRIRFVAAGLLSLLAVLSFVEVFSA